MLHFCLVSLGCPSPPTAALASSAIHSSPACPHSKLLLSLLLQCLLVFDLQLSTYSSGKAKIAFGINLLLGHAVQWVTVIIKNRASKSVNFEEFMAKLCRIWPPCWGGEAMTRLFSFCQGLHLLLIYSIQLWIYELRADGMMQSFKWSSVVLMRSSSMSLLKGILDLESLISLSIYLINCLMERWTEKQRIPHEPGSFHSISKTVGCVTRWS